MVPPDIVSDGFTLVLALSGCLHILLNLKRVVFFLYKIGEFKVEVHRY